MSEKNEIILVLVATDTDIVIARQAGRTMAAEMGFSSTEAVLVATAISELARNIYTYASQGEITIRPMNGTGRKGIEIVALDHGPGIPDVQQAVQKGYSTSGGLGLGLPGVRWLMDEFAIVSRVGEGTTVTARKWKLQDVKPRDADLGATFLASKPLPS